MYEADSFFTLSVAGQAGLLAVSLGLALGTSWSLRRLTAGHTVFVRLSLWALHYYVFVWLSPQGYYGYYLLIFEDLPLQWVISRPPSLFDFLRGFTFSGPDTLSAHGLGALGWLLLIPALWPQRSNCRDAAN